MTRVQTGQIRLEPDRSTAKWRVKQTVRLFPERTTAFKTILPGGKEISANQAKHRLIRAIRLAAGCGQ